MNPVIKTWLTFVAVLAVMLAMMTWLSGVALDLERRNIEAQKKAVIEENVRLSLWRVDTMISPLFAAESIRPVEDYASSFGREDEAAQSSSAQTETRVSSLIGDTSPEIKLYFSILPDGSVQSPQVPSGRAYTADLVDPERLATLRDNLATFRNVVGRDQLLALLPTNKKPLYTADLDEEYRSASSSHEARQQMLNDSGYGQRGSFNRNWVQQQKRIASAVFSRDRLAAMHSVSIAGQLLFVRRVSIKDSEVIQGCWLDWEYLRRDFAREINDLLPNASFVIRPDGPSVNRARRLVSLPAELVPGAIDFEPETGASMVKIALGAAWISVIFAALTLAVLLFGLVSLGERRAAFVSAVTHELRTPLTTFKMYSEMLFEGMVPEKKRSHYLQTLCTEADRLDLLVKNVLEYSRIEGRRRKKRLERVPALEIVRSFEDRLRQRATDARFDFEIVADENVADVKVSVDANALEQIMFNLVDNACKYARHAANPRIEIRVAGKSNRVEYAVCDNGPGVGKADRKILFRPFAKSDQASANSEPGVGLGLALCRRLAGSFGATLRLDDSYSSGARFVLSVIPDFSNT